MIEAELSADERERAHKPRRSQPARIEAGAAKLVAASRGAPGWDGDSARWYCLQVVVAGCEFAVETF